MTYVDFAGREVEDLELETMRREARLDAGPLVGCSECGDWHGRDLPTCPIVIEARAREAQARRNPILGLPSAYRLEERPPEARRVLRDVLLELAAEANVEAERSWSKRKGPMAAYWRAVSTYAKHLARATARAREV